MSDIYQTTIEKYKGSPTIVVIFFFSVLMFAIGLNHFIEDTWSSFYGLKSLEATYGLNIQIFDWSYWTMSLAPQVATLVFFYIYLSNNKVKWPLYVSLGAQAMDFFADSWYRGNGNLLQSWDVFLISGLLTFVYFTIGSEFFLSVGGGLIIKLIAPAIQTWKVNIGGIAKAAKGEYRPEGSGGGDKSKGDHGGRGKPRTENIRPEIAERMGMRRGGDIPVTTRPPIGGDGMRQVDHSQMGEGGGRNGGGEGATGQYKAIPRD
jgi:hypothetical protein